MLMVSPTDLTKHLGCPRDADGQRHPVGPDSILVVAPYSARVCWLKCRLPTNARVAVSRSRCVTILVGSPALLDVPVHRPEQVPLVNAPCRFVEEASA